MKWLKELVEDEAIVTEIKQRLAKEFVPKHEFNTKISEVRELKEQVADRDNQLEVLKKDAEGNQDLIDKIEKLEQDYEEKITSMKKRQIASKMLLESKAKDVDVNMALFNLEDYTLSDTGDELVGFKEALDKHKEEYGYLYKSDKQSYGGFKPVDGMDNSDKNTDTSLGEQFAKRRNEQSKVESSLWD